MNKEALNILLEEWQTIHKKNYILVQNHKAGTDIKVSPFDVNLAIRACEIAKLIQPHLDELNCSPEERLKICEDAEL